eukprot:5234964-Amphidinium_carterae.1
MQAVTYFSIHTNSFTGSLPDGGMRTMRALRFLFTSENQLAGMLPEGICVEAATRVFIDNNCFAGTVAESLRLNSNPNLSPPK